MWSYLLLMTFTLIVSLSYTILSFNFFRIEDSSIIYGIVNVCDTFLSPLYVFTFLFDRKRFIEMSNMICCRKKFEEIENIEDEYQMEIL